MVLINICLCSIASGIFNPNFFSLIAVFGMKANFPLLPWFDCAAMRCKVHVSILFLVLIVHLIYCFPGNYVV